MYNYREGVDAFELIKNALWIKACIYLPMTVRITVCYGGVAHRTKSLSTSPVHDTLQCVDGSVLTVELEGPEPSLSD